MINALWAGLTVCAVIAGTVTGRLSAVGQAALDSSAQAVELSIGLLGGYVFWCGVMGVMREAGWTSAVQKWLDKPLRLLFPQAKTVKSREAIAANLSANCFGVGNAATPAGLRAMKELAKSEPRKGYANDAMCMLLVINASSIQLIPTGVIALRQSAGSADPAAILPLSLIATAVSTLVGILAAKGFSKVWK